MIQCTKQIQLWCINNSNAYVVRLALSLLLVIMVVSAILGDADSTLARDIMLCFAIREAKAAFGVSRFRQLDSATTLRK